MAAHFDSEAHKWDTNTLIQTLAVNSAKTLKHLLSDLPSTATALDFGGGTGTVSEKLLDHFSSVYVVDVSKEMIARAQGKHPKLHAIHADLSQQSLPIPQVDCIYAVLVLHHIPQVEPILEQLATYLKPGGRILILDFIDGFPDLSQDEQVQLGVHHHGFTEVQMRDLLKGFDKVDIGFAYQVKDDGSFTPESGGHHHHQHSQHHRSHHHHSHSHSHDTNHSSKDKIFKVGYAIGYKK